MPPPQHSSLPPAVEAILDDRVPAAVVLHVSGDWRLLESRGGLDELGLSDLRPGQDVAAALPFLTGSALSDEQRLICVDIGTGHAADIAQVPDGAGGAWLVFVSAEEQRRQRQALQHMGNEARLMNHRQQRLVDDLIEARSELDLRRREAEDALRARNRFIASLSHEFRTPLTSVIGYAEWLSRSLEEPARRQSRAIARAGQHMLTLVDNLLEQARLQDDTAAPRRDPVAVRALAEDISAIMAPLAADKAISFAAYVAPEVPDVVMLDEMRIRQVLINLLGNAVKFTNSGFVRLSLGYGNGQLHIEVADSGPGIADADRARIFGAFERLEGAHQQAGAGLGLHITLQIVRLLDGSIGLDSEPGRGTHFHVRLPAPPGAPVPAGDEPRGGHLLIAEDDADIVRLLELYLTRAGFRLTLVADGRQAVDSALREQPDLVVLDLNMPVLDGIGAVRELRKADYRGPVVALTGATLDDDRLRAVEAGFDGFIAKPVRMPELMSTLRELLA